MKPPVAVDDDRLAASIAVHDALLERRGVEIWVGAEPTFTRADSVEPAWLAASEGDDKLERAYAVAVHLADAIGDASCLRVLGRKYDGESTARFAFGVRWPAQPTRGEMDAEPAEPPETIGDDHWVTVAPDPGVVEVNLAPCSTAAALSTQARQVWAAAARAGLSPVRYRFNGDTADSGGGGQITIGGPSPMASPFVRYPHVLPALVRYFNNHPSLSYWFAGEHAGSSSQAPRPDEGTRERWDELGVALGWLESRADRSRLKPELLWQTLSPVLVDAAGNSHRTELNIEKLWNPYVTRHGLRHGKMGLVELRAIRMPERPGMMVALAVLVRSIVARLVVDEYRAPLIDWHDELHDQFALPSALARDLRLVLGDLDEHSLGLPAALRHELDAWRTPGVACHLGDATLTIRPALEFWPLLGDVASQERSTARIVDASTSRVELAFDGAGPARIAVAGRWVIPRPLGGGPGSALDDNCRAIGVRRRVFTPSPGLHPELPPTDPLVIEWAWAGRTQRIELWGWKPDGSDYAGVPVDASDALARRQARIHITTTAGETVAAEGHWPELRPFTVDLRRG